LNGEKRLMGVMYNDAGNFIDIWTRLEVNKDSPCVYTKGMDYLEFPVRHGEGKVVAHKKHADTIWQKLRENNQVTVRYCLRRQDEPADGKFPDNPNGSKYDTAGICDRTGRVFGLMPHPEAYNHCTNHYLYSREKERRRIEGLPPVSEEGAGIQIFRNAVRYAEENLL
jgi:phosphoribosylformylglycinamidine (FGAM) synthase-like amidotransferase family enzyme